MTEQLQQAWLARVKLWAEGDKLRAEGNKLRAEGDKLWAEGNKLYAEGVKLWAEGNLAWLNAVIATYGNIQLKWIPRGENYDCWLDVPGAEGGETYRWEPQT